MTDLLSRLRSVMGGRYRVDREIGRGGMAAVFLAADIKHDREVAIKVLHPEVAAAIGSERFLREINIAAHLRHPHIVPLLDSGEADGLLYYVMPHVEGQSLRQRIATQGPLDVTEAVRYWRDVVDAIAYAHRQHILHRDIKPENVLVSERHAMVVDFGIAKALRPDKGTSTLTGVGTAIGTPAYMAPEQAMVWDEIDNRADIYAMGVVAYEMLTGKAPFASEGQSAMAAKISAPAPDVRQHCPQVSPDIARLIRRCLEPDRDRRWRDADELLTALESAATPPAGMVATAWRHINQTRTRRNLVAAGAIVAVGILTAAAYTSISRSREQAWARGSGLTELRRLWDAAQVDSAYVTAVRLRSATPGDPEVDSLWKLLTVEAKLETVPSGARVSWAAYRGDTSEWHEIGVTPVRGVAIPAPSRTIAYLIKYEAQGYRTAIRPLGAEVNASTPAVLDPVGGPHAEMVRIRGGRVPVPDPSRPEGERLRLPDFYIDRLEVTNREYRRFVEARGYDRQEFWEHPVIEAGRTLPRSEARSRFVDRTGRPGPATWEGGDVPRGRENYPVSGISWYEAQAYAKFAGKQLPTLFHWRRAANLIAASWILPRSNIESQGLVPAGTTTAFTGYGVHDMAGNVREWCVNADGPRRYILGGGWSENAYVFHDPITVDPLDRSEINGIRLMLPAPGTSAAATQGFARPFPRGFRDYTKETPAGDEEFRSFLPFFAYDRTALNAVVVEVDSSHSSIIKQRVAFDAAYGQERMEAILFLPRHTPPPYQTIVFFPGAQTVDLRSIKDIVHVPEYVATNGRALMYPVYKSTYERGGSESMPMGTDLSYNMTGGLLGPNTYRDLIVMIVKDLKRSVDYLATRPDVDTTRLGYLGFSWGGRLGPINIVAEGRFKAAVFQLPGLNSAPRRREVDELHYLPRVRIPTLVMSGRYDDVFPLQTMVLPFVQHLGTPAAHKRHEVYPTQHFLPRAPVIRETLDWFDRYLGKPR